jgi:CheY-like chemotaxis protein
MMILFIDDEKFFNESYHEALVEAGYEVVFEGNINNSIAFLESNPQNLQAIILDIMFSLTSDLDKRIDRAKTDGGMRAGEELLRLINQMPHLTNVPKIILTNVAKEEFFARHSQSGDVSMCLRKRNVLPSKLVDVVNQCINKESSRCK